MITQDLQTHAVRPGETTVRILPEGFVKHAGGVRRSSYDLLRSLREVGVGIEVDPWVDRNPFRFGTPAPSKLRRARLQLSAMSSLLIKPRATPISHSLYYDPAALATKGILVATAYDMIHERFGYGSTALRQAKRRVLERADVVVTISAATAADVLEYLPAVKDVVPIHLGIQSGLMTAPLPQNDSDRRSVLYVGYRHRHKNFALVLGAYRSSRELRTLPLVLVGGPQLTTSERAEIMAATGRPAEQYSGVGDDSLREFYDRALVTVIPSRWEGFGLPVLEAMARNCPVACSNTASLAETSGGHARLFDAESNDDCAAAILAAADEVESSRRAARAYALGFTWQATASKHLELYAGLL